MSTDIHLNPPNSQLPDAAKDLARRAAEAAKETGRTANTAIHDARAIVQDAAADVRDIANQATKSASDAAKELYQSAAVKAGETLDTSREYVRQNPLPVVVGAVAFGAIVGYILVTSRRKPTFGERYADEPMAALREALLAALTPVAHRVHEGYDSAREGAGKAMDQVHNLASGRNGSSLSHRISRIGNHLKFW